LLPFRYRICCAWQPCRLHQSSRVLGDARPTGGRPIMLITVMGQAPNSLALFSNDSTSLSPKCPRLPCALVDSNLFETEILLSLEINWRAECPEVSATVACVLFLQSQSRVFSTPKNMCDAARFKPQCLLECSDTRYIVR